LGDANLVTKLAGVFRQSTAIAISHAGPVHHDPEIKQTAGRRGGAWTANADVTETHGNCPFVRERRGVRRGIPVIESISVPGHTMTTPLKSCAAITLLLLAAPPAWAGPCTNTIASVQAQVDAAIENRAGSDGWKPQSLAATRSYQPTPRSLAATEGRNGAVFDYALDALDRARAADRAADSATCHQELANARAALRQ
jgi:hypothetical protein